MDETIPWSRWVGLIEPFYYSGYRGRKPKALETMLLHFRHLLEKHQLGRKLLESRGEIFE